MKIDIDKVHVFEIAKVGDRRRLQQMALEGRKLFEAEVKESAPVNRKPRVITFHRAQILAQAPHLAWKEPVSQAA